VEHHAVRVVTVRYYPHPGPLHIGLDTPLATQLLDAGKAVRIPLRDHIVLLQDGEYFSFREDEYTIQITKKVLHGAGVAPARGISGEHIP
jgi:DNA repair protein RadC